MRVLIENYIEKKFREALMDIKDFEYILIEKLIIIERIRLTIIKFKPDERVKRRQKKGKNQSKSGHQSAAHDPQVNSQQ